MKKFFSVSLYFGIVAFIIGLVSNATGWLAIGGGFAFVGLVGLLLCIMNREE